MFPCLFTYSFPYLFLQSCACGTIRGSVCQPCFVRGQDQVKVAAMDAVITTNSSITANRSSLVSDLLANEPVGS